MPTNAEQVYQYLQTQGLPAGAAAGVVGNLVVESGVTPSNASGDGGTSGGIAQWHNGRWSALKAFAAGLGKPWQSLDVQEAFLVKESKSSGLWAKLVGTNDPAAAASLFAAQFERPASKDYSGRQAAAAKVYASGGAGIGSSGDATGGGGITGQTVADTGPGGWVGSLTDGLKGVAFKGIAGVFGLALIGYGVVTAAKRSGS